LLKPQRQALHRRAADWNAGRDAVLHAEHLDRANDPQAPRAYLVAAQAQAAAFRNDQALQLVESGLARATERADMCALTLLKGQLLHDVGAIADSIWAYETVLQNATGDTERCRAWLGLAQGMRITDRLPEALATLEKAEVAATSCDLRPELAQIHHLRGNLYFPLGRLDDCRREHELALDEARRSGSVELEALALGGLGDSEYVRGRMHTAYQCFRRCVDLARAHGFGRIEVANLPMVAICQLYRADLRDALSQALAGAEAADRVGHFRAQLNALQIGGQCLFEMGEMARAKRLLEQARPLIQRLGARRFEPFSLFFIAKIMAIQGQYAEAIQLLERAVMISRETGPSFAGPMALGALAVVTHDAEVRQTSLAEGERLLAAGCVSHNYFWFYADAMEAALATGDWDEVDRYAASLETYTKPEPLPWADFFIARGRALAALGRSPSDAAPSAALIRLRDEGQRLGLVTALPAMEAAFAGGKPS
jgi:tetratricopeptide (TPR) repeat protein